MGFRDQLCQSPSNDGVESQPGSVKGIDKRLLPRSPILSSQKKSLTAEEKRGLRGSKSNSLDSGHVRPVLDKKGSRVRFQTDESQNIKCSFIPSTLLLGDLERKELWWTPQEAEMMTERTLAIAESYMEVDSYVEKFLQLFTQCAQAEEGKFPQVSKNDAYQLFQTSARGLEVIIFSVLQRYRSRHVDAILCAQESMSDFVDLEVRNQRLSELSRKYSRTASALASVVAMTDAEFVRTP